MIRWPVTYRPSPRTLDERGYASVEVASSCSSPTQAAVCGRPRPPARQYCVRGAWYRCPDGRGSRTAAATTTQAASPLSAIATRESDPTRQQPSHGRRSAAPDPPDQVSPEATLSCQPAQVWSKQASPARCVPGPSRLVQGLYSRARLIVASLTGAGRSTCSMPYSTNRTAQPESGSLAP
jgi:hypothetical protein